MLIGIQTRGIGNVDVATASSKSKATDEKATDAFSSLMNLAQQSQITNDSPSETMDKTDSETMSVQGKNTKQTGSQQVDNNYRTNQKKEPDNKESFDGAVSGDEKKISSEQTKDTNVTEEIGDQETAVLDAIMNLLGVDMQQIESFLQEQGVTVQDLLNPDVLQQFVMEVKGVSQLDLLTNEQLNAQITEIMNQFEEVLQGGSLDQSDLQDVYVVQTEAVMEDGATELQLKNEESKVEQPEEAVALADESTAVKHEEPKQNHTQNVQSTQKESEGFVQIKTEDGTFGRSGEHFSNQGQHTDVMFQLEQAVGQAVDVSNIQEELGMADYQPLDIVQQVVEQVKVQMSKDVTSLTLQLYPQELGKVQIHVTEHEGVMQARIIAENEAAKHAIETGLQLLKETFEDRSLKVDAIEVMVGAEEFFANPEGQNDEFAQQEKQRNLQGGINLNEISDDEISEEEQVEVELMRANGNQVSYRA